MLMAAKGLLYNSPDPAAFRTGMEKVVAVVLELVAGVGRGGHVEELADGECGEGDCDVGGNCYATAGTNVRTHPSKMYNICF